MVSISCPKCGITVSPTHCRKPMSFKAGKLSCAACKMEVPTLDHCGNKLAK